MRKYILLISYFNIFKNIICFNNPACGSLRYRCSSTNPSNVCVEIVGDKKKDYFLNPCQTGYWCPWWLANENNLQVSCIQNVNITLSLPGQQCIQNSDCHSGICSSKICVGKALDQVCALTKDCNVGMYCHKDLLKCTLQTAFDQICNSDFDCQNNCVCNMGKCSYYYSLANGIAADNSKSCLSGYINNGQCEESRISLYKGRPCMSDQDCILIDKFGNFKGYSQCQCGFNGGSFTYCQLSEGDSEFQSMVDNFQYILRTNFLCHSELRFGPCQNLYQDEYIAYQISYHKYYMHAQIEFNDKCIQSIYTNQYWIFYYKKSKILMTFVNFILIFIFYIQY